MHWIADLLAVIGVVLNGIPQGIMAWDWDLPCSRQPSHLY